MHCLLNKYMYMGVLTKLWLVKEVKQLNFGIVLQGKKEFMDVGIKEFIITGDHDSTHSASTRRR